MLDNQTSDVATVAGETGRGQDEMRHDWSREDAQRIYDLPFNELLFQAQCVHRRHFDPNTVQKCQLLSIKTGGCPEDCSYCSQSSRYETGLKASKLMALEEVLEGARAAKANGATR